MLISSDCIKWINALYNFPVKSTKITDKNAVCVASLKWIVHVDKILKKYFLSDFHIFEEVNNICFNLLASYYLNIIVFKFPFWKEKV